MEDEAKPAVQTAPLEGGTTPPSSLSERFWVGPFDLRTAGLFRISFGLAAFVAVADLGPVLFDVLGDDGVMPRSAMLAGIVRTNRFSIFDVAGPHWVTGALWGLTLLAVLAFAVGFRTRLASVAAFVLVTGMHERNLQVFDGSDNVIRVLLFWSMFMDLGARYSIDALLRGRVGLPRRDFGWAFPVRMAQLQFAWIYLNTFIWKAQGQYWFSGTALRFALGLDHLFTRTLGAKLFDAAWFIVPASYYTLGMEGAFLFLVFAPFGQPRLRAVALISGVLLHAGIWMLMNVGDFSYVMPASYALFFEPQWAEWTLAELRRRSATWLGPARMERAHALGVAILERLPQPRGSTSLEPRFPGLRRALRGLFTPIFAAILACCMWFCTPPKLVQPMPDWLHGLVQELEVWQSWDMFAPDPMNTDSWLKGNGTLTDGTEVDVLRGNGGGPLTSIYPHFYFSRWTKIENTLAYSEQPVLLQFGKFLCRDWNNHPPQGRKQLKDFKIYRVERHTPELGKPPPEWADVLVWEHHCF